MNTQLMSREQAMKLGMNKGQLNHLLRTKRLKYVVGTDHLLDKEQVLAAFKELSRRRRTVLTQKNIKLAARALRVCSVLMRHAPIRNCFTTSEVSELVKAAEAFEYKLKTKENAKC